MNAGYASAPFTRFATASSRSMYVASWRSISSMWPVRSPSSTMRA